MQESESTERALVACVLDDPSIFPTMSELVAADDFFFSRPRTIWRAIEQLVSAGTGVDLVTVEAQLVKQKELDNAGGLQYLLECNQGEHFVANAESYADIVRHCAATRSVKDGLATALLEVEGGDDPWETIGRAYITVNSTMRNLEAKTKQVGLVQVIDEIAAIQDGSADPVVHSGFDSLEDYCPQVGDLVVIAARPSTGKTALAIQLAMNQARQGKQVAFYSVEMTRSMILKRLLSLLSGIPMCDLVKRGRLSADDFNRLGQAAQSIKEIEPNLTIIGGTNKLESIVSDIQTRRGLEVVYIDHLHLVKLPDKDTKEQEIAAATGTLARMSKTLGLTTFLLAQLNRETEYRASKEPQLSDLRGSGAIEQDIDIGWFLYRADRYDEDEPSDMKVLIRKNRNGPIGYVWLGFKPETGRFYDKLGE